MSEVLLLFARGPGGRTVAMLGVTHGELDALKAGRVSAPVDLEAMALVTDSSLPSELYLVAGPDDASVLAEIKAITGTEPEHLPPRRLRTV